MNYTLKDTDGAESYQSKEDPPPYTPIFDHNNESVNQQGVIHGLTAFTAAVFIVGEMAGSGVLALPDAVANSGFIGIVLICVLGMLSGICGIALGKAWLILTKDFTEYQGQIRYPYPALGYHSYGRVGKYAVVICINATLIGACTVFILLASENLNSLISFNIASVSAHNEYRLWLLICVVLVWPLTWLGTPKNFWPVALIAIIATTIGCVLITAKMAYDFEGGAPKRKLTAGSFFSAFGAIAFSFGGTATFPTIQTDMKRPSIFHTAVIFAYLCVLALYLPVSTLGFFAYGDNIQPNILKNLPSSSPVTKCVEALIASHLLFSFVIVINPVSQQLEEWFNVPAGRLTVRRCIVRSCLVLFILALAQGIPHFGLFLNLVGSSTTCLLTFVFPCLFYLKLENGLSLHMKVMLIEIVGFGCLAGITSTYFAIKAIVDELSS